MQKTTVALLFGGRSAEHEVSLQSAAAIHAHLDRAKYRVLSVYLDKRGGWSLVSSPDSLQPSLPKTTSSSFLPWQGKQPAGRLKADIYFPVLHGPFGEDGTVQGLFEMADVPYVGAGVAASALGMDKALAKAVFEAKGLPVVPYVALREAEWKKDKESAVRSARRRLRLPLFVKPSNLGSSVGITKVKRWADAGRACRKAFSFDRTILIEQGISAREIECSVLGNERPEASLPGEVIPHREFYDYADKYLEGKTEFKVPARIPAPAARKVQELSLAAFRAVGCAGMARVDFLLEKGTGLLYLSELNTIPGFTKISMYPRLWEASGLPFPRLLDKLIALGLERHASKKRRFDRAGP